MKMNLKIKQQLYITGRGVTFICSFKDNGCNSEEEKHQLMADLKGKAIAHPPIEMCDVRFPDNIISSFDTQSTLMDKSTLKDLFGVICVDGEGTSYLKIIE